MAAKNKKQSGQALVEFIVFLPFMVMMYSVVITLANAINGSINQQKAARGYFYYRLQNSSVFPRPTLGDGGQNFASWRQFGFTFMGWMDYLDGSTPVAPCYKLNLPFATAATDKCEDAYTTKTTQYIRVGTVYGVCGATFFNDSGIAVQGPIMSGNGGSVVSQVVDHMSCTITR